MTKLIIKEIAYILIIIVIPLIILGIAIIKSKSYRKLIISIVTILIIATYAIFAKSLIKSAETIISTISTEDAKSKDLGTDITYLKNYTEKISKNSYITKFDVEQIIDISDSKSKEIKINYKDSSDGTDITVSNKEDDKIKELKEILKADCYKFNYEIDNNKQIIINIERYVL